MQEVFSAVLERPAHAREAFLRDACGTDTALFREVRELLQAYQEMDPRTGLAGEPTEGDLLGASVGSYRILRLLGSGGMGQVYLASRDDGAFERYVAVKVVNPALAPADLFERFEDECRILALLNHPFIAKLLDAGRLPDHRMYLVMEYVDGVPLTTHCQRHSLKLPDRLSLFREVCDAVSAAHRNFVVHRDLKPSNILVDADGKPKLLDFGIAKAMTRAGLEAGPATDPILKRATPAYASPEQVQGEAAHAGMDVFALGVILHELLTGVRPQTLPNAEVTTTDRGVFQKPSEVASGTFDATDAVSPFDIDPDLDAIVLKAIHPDPRRRYATVDTLTRDLVAWQAHYPVDARQGSVAYRARKFVRRNRILTTAAVIVVAAVAVAGVSLVRSWQSARRERTMAIERFDASRTLAASLSSVDDALMKVPGTTVSRQALVQTLSDYLQKLRQYAQGDAALMLDIAEGYRRLGDVLGNPNTSNLGDRPRALAMYGEATGILRQLQGADSPSAGIAVALTRTLGSTGDVLAAQGQYASALAAYEEARGIAERLAQSHPMDAQYPALAAAIYRPIGDVALTTGDAATALASYGKAVGIELALAQKHGTTPERQRLVALSRLRESSARAIQGAWVDARAESEIAIGILQGLRSSGQRLPGLERDIAVAHLQIARFSRAKNPHDAEQQCAQGIALLRELVAADPADARLRRDLVAGLVQFGDAVRVKDFDRARTAYREAQVLAQALHAESAGDAQSERDLLAIKQRLAAGPELALPRFALSAIVGGRRLTLGPGDSLPPNANQLAIAATAPAGWSRYLVTFGAEGPASVLDESQLAKTSWTLPIDGPPPAQTVILVVVPRPMSNPDRERLANEIGAIPGPRTVDWDSQVVWTSDAEPAIVSLASTRGEKPSTDWIKRVRSTLDKVDGAEFAGRTIPIAAIR